MPNAEIGHIKIGRIDARKIRLPWETRFVGAAGIKRRHVRIQASHYLDNRKTFRHAVCR